MTLVIALVIVPVIVSVTVLVIVLVTVQDRHEGLDHGTSIEHDELQGGEF